MITQTTELILYVEFSPRFTDPVTVLSEEEYWTDELPANYSYERICIPGDFSCEEAFWEWVYGENEERCGW